MLESGPGLATIVGSVILYVLAYINHDAGSGSPLVGTIAAPRWVRRLVRFGDGPVRISSVTFELLALALAAAGVLVMTHVAPANLIFQVGSIGAPVAIGVDVAIELVDRRRRRRGEDR